MEIHNPDFIGPVNANENEGIAGQVLTSGGSGVQVGWSTPAAAASEFQFTSASATSHVINHNLNNGTPVVTVWDSTSFKVIQPMEISSNSPNQLTITFFTVRGISGTVVG